MLAVWPCDSPSLVFTFAPIWVRLYTADSLGGGRLSRRYSMASVNPFQLLLYTLCLSGLINSMVSSQHPQVLEQTANVTVSIDIHAHQHTTNVFAKLSNNASCYVTATFTASTESKTRSLLASGKYSPRHTCTAAHSRSTQQSVKRRHKLQAASIPP